MIRLFFRKVFYDIWDNFFYSLAFNFIITIICAIGVQVYVRMPTILLQTVAAAVFFLPAGVLLTAASQLYGQVSDYRSFTFRDFPSALKESWKTGLAFFAILFFAFLFLFVAVPFYFYMMTLPAFLIGALLFWLAVFLLAALQWFLPVYYRLNKNFKTCLKKSFLLFFDNAAISLFLLAFSALLLAVSFFLGFLIPGWTSVLIAGQGILRLLMFKYDWMEEEEKKALAADETGVPDTGSADFTTPKPRGKRPRVPWSEILADEDENVGHRTLKNFLLPWKD